MMRATIAWALLSFSSWSFAQTATPIVVQLPAGGSQTVTMQVRNNGTATADLRFVANVPWTLSEHSLSAAAPCGISLSGAQSMLVANQVPAGATVNCAVTVTRSSAPEARGATLRYALFSFGSGQILTPVLQIGPALNLNLSLRQVAPFPGPLDVDGFLEATIQNQSNVALTDVQLGTCAVGSFDPQPILANPAGDCEFDFGSSGNNCQFNAVLRSLPASASRVCRFQYNMAPGVSRNARLTITDFTATDAMGYRLHDATFEDDLASLVMLGNAAPVPAADRGPILMLALLTLLGGLIWIYLRR